jgi:hypothetical protein
VSVVPPTQTHLPICKKLVSISYLWESLNNHWPLLRLSGIFFLHRVIVWDGATTRIKKDVRSFIQRNKFFPITHLLEEEKKQWPLTLNTFTFVELKKKIKAVRDYEVKKSHQFDSISNRPC